MESSYRIRHRQTESAPPDTPTSTLPPSGTSILPKAAQIYATIHPYIGDMSANEKTLAALGISNVFSIANFKLQTTETPYGWTIYLDDAFTKKQQTTVEKTMKNYAMVILACTKNLGSVTFSYTLDGKTTDFTYTKADGCVIEGEVENSVLFRGVHVGKGAKVKNCVLMQDTVVEDNASVEYVITDKNVRVTEGKSLTGNESYQVYVSKGQVV